MSEFQVLDLLAIRGLIEKRPEYGHIADLITRLNKITAARRDLRTAQRCFQRLVDNFIPMQHPGERYDQSADTAEIGAALLCQGIISYCRATDTTNKGQVYRGPRKQPARKKGIVARLSPASRAAHDEIKPLRDTAIAHDGGGGDNWLKTALVFRVDAEGGRVMNPWARQNWRAAQCQRFLDLTTEAITLADEIFNELHDDFMAHILAAWLNDGAFLTQCRSLEFAPSTIYSTEESLKRWTDIVRVNGSSTDNMHTMTRAVGSLPVARP